MSQPVETTLPEREPTPTKRPVHLTRLPPAFWDNLPNIPLTRNALAELNRRNQTNLTQACPPCRPIPRRTARKPINTLRRCDLARVKRFARHGGPGLSELRGYRSEPPGVTGMSSRQPSRSNRRRGRASSRLGRSRAASQCGSTSSRNTRVSTRTKSTGPYDPAFDQHLINHGVYPAEYSYPRTDIGPPPPNNLEEIIRFLKRPHPSVSQFTEEDFRAFKRADANASKESKVMSRVIPIIEGEIEDDRCASGDHYFTNLDPLTDGTLTVSCPDLYYGSRPEQLNKGLQEELSRLIAPSPQTNLPIAPNFFLAVKGPDGSLAVANRQARYDGALGARGIHSLLTYGKGKSPKYDNNAYTLTSIYYGGILKMYTSHLVPPTRSARPEYAMTQVAVSALSSDLDTFKAGVSAYRNGRDWAEQKRDEAIRAANQALVHVDVGSDASMDELAR
ncbi:hypothetical protein F4861DRAFT_538448 [Xylaria intraflava]|nr:hypothetical protein F4861DRAFT_538448 [Xylaria intraflava]